MMKYDALPVLFQIVLMFGLFLILCGSIYIMVITLRKRPLYITVSILLCTIISAGMMLLYTADVRSVKKDLSYAAVSRWLCEKNVVYTIVMMALMIVVLVCILIRELRLRNTFPARTAIKESIDHLPTGLCFYEENGRVMLVNHRMNGLCHAILGRDLQNGALMWQDLCSGDHVLPSVVRLSFGTQPSFRLSDGSVWSFSQTDLEGVIQLTAIDSTKLHGLLEDLSRKNSDLESLYLRLKQYEENVDRLSREKERLETKIGIHSELGQTLLATRSYLLSGKEDKTVPTDAWKYSIALLRSKAVYKSETFSLSTLIQTAHSFGITVEEEGQIPRCKDVERLFLEAATEALTNAVRHAGAKVLYIRFFEDDTNYYVSFRNDGKLPEDTITEGGGLSSLRRKVETKGAEMQIVCRPEYSLTVTMPKEGKEIK